MLMNRLKIVMIEKKITQEQLAKLRGVSRNTVTNWVTGKTTPPLEEAFDIAEFFGVPITDIWRKENTEKDIKKEGH